MHFYYGKGNVELNFKKGITRRRMMFNFDQLTNGSYLAHSKKTYISYENYILLYI